MYTKELIINNSEEMINLGEQIGKLTFPNCVIAMSGDLGAGKTTFTKGIGKGLNITRLINSPTFTIMKIYDGKYRLYHLDVYRIDNENDDFELEEYFYSDGVCVIEWAENVKDLLPDNYLKIDIYDIGDNHRKLVLSSDGDNYIKIIEALK